MYRSLRGEEQLAFRSRFTSTPPPIVTALIIGVLVRFFWWGGVPELDFWFDTHLVKDNGAIFEDGEGWRLITMGLLHGNTTHILSNCLFLTFAAYNLERTIGWANLAVVFGAAVVGGSVLSALLGPETPSIGASGGVYGLIAAMVTVAASRPDVLDQRGRIFFLLTSLPYMVIYFVNGLSSEQVDNAAHFGGLVTGLVLGVLFVPAAAERRPGDNGRARSGVIELALLAMVVPFFAGPLIEPLQDAGDRRRKVPYVDSRLAELGVIEGPERSERALNFRVPASWVSSFDVTRAPAFTSSSGNGSLRAWRVAEREHNELVDIEGLAAAWVDDLREDWPEAIVEGPQPASLTGRDGLAVQARIGRGPDARVLEWRGATQGVWSLQTVWQVEPERMDRLKPLQQRLLDHVEWAVPTDLQRAEIEIATFPDSPKAIQDLARQQIRAGDWEAGVERLWAFVQEDRDSPARWASALADLRPALTRLRDPDRWFGGALENAPVPKVVEEVVSGLETLDRSGEAIGLIELAWRQSPGDRRLRRARRSMGLPKEVDPASGRPWEEVYDPETGLPRPSNVTDGRLGLASAAEAGAAYAAARRDLVDRTQDWVERSDPRALAPLLFLRFGKVDLKDDDAVRTLVQELEQVVDGRTLGWLPADIADALVRKPSRLDGVRSGIQSG